MAPVRLAWAGIPEGTARREVAWSLLRDLAPGARITNPCPWCGGAHGPVQLHGTGLVASVSYAGDVAVVGVADSSAVARLGVDAEPLGDVGRHGARLDDLLEPRRSLDLRGWTRIEAALKADGRGLRVDPTRVEVWERDAKPAELGMRWAARLPDRDIPVEGVDLAGPPGILVSAATLPAGTPAKQENRPPAVPGSDQEH